MDDKDQRVWVVENDLVEKLEKWEGMKEELKWIYEKMDKKEDRKEMMKEIEVLEDNQASLKRKLEEMIFQNIKMSKKNFVAL